MKQAISTGILSLTFAAALGPVTTAAAGFYEDAPPRDIDMCVAEIRARADLSGAARVRHDIISTTKRAVGFSIEIDTTVYASTSGAVLREYESVCIATGGQAPSRFRMSEKE